MYKLLLQTVVFLHYVGLIIMALAVVITPILSPWYIGIPIAILITRIPLSRTECPMSLLEVYLARKAGMPEKKVFIRDHVIPEMKLLVSKIRRYRNEK